MQIDKSNWCASQWQAYTARLPDFEDRKHALEHEVPESMRERVKGHLVTVRQIKARVRK